MFIDSFSPKRFVRIYHFFVYSNLQLFNAMDIQVGTILRRCKYLWDSDGMEWHNVHHDHETKTLGGRQLESSRALATGKFVPHASCQQKQQILNASLTILFSTGVCPSIKIKINPTKTENTHLKFLHLVL
jgi:hypothetical protein